MEKRLRHGPRTTVRTAHRARPQGQPRPRPRRSFSRLPRETRRGRPRLGERYAAARAARQWSKVLDVPARTSTRRPSSKGCSGSPNPGVVPRTAVQGPLREAARELLGALPRAADRDATDRRAAEQGRCVSLRRRPLRRAQRGSRGHTTAAARPRRDRRTAGPQRETRAARMVADALGERGFARRRNPRRSSSWALDPLAEPLAATADALAQAGPPCSAERRGAPARRRLLPRRQGEVGFHDRDGVLLVHVGEASTECAWPACPQSRATPNTSRLDSATPATPRQPNRSRGVRLSKPTPSRVVAT